MNLTDIFTGLTGNTKAKDVASPESSAGGPVYDAKIDPAIADALGVENTRLQLQRNYHLFYDKTAAAQAFSHYWESTPSPTALALTGLGEQAAQLNQHFERTWEQPFPGVPLGHVPSFQRAPDTVPTLITDSHMQAKTHGAHRIESRRASRARFGS